MISITRNYGTIIEDPHARVEAAKNDLLDRMYHARELPTMGGREVWLDLLDMYYTGSWDEMIETISLFTGPGATSSTSISSLQIVE